MGVHGGAVIQECLARLNGRCLQRTLSMSLLMRKQARMVQRRGRRHAGPPGAPERLLPVAHIQHAAALQQNPARMV